MDTRRKLAEADPTGGEGEDGGLAALIDPAADISATKLARFTGALPHASRKQSKFERERQVELEREKRQQLEAADAYDEFVKAFGGDDEDVGPSSSTRPGEGGRYGRSRGPTKGFVKAGGDEKYNPFEEQRSRAAANPPPSRPPPPPSASAAKPKPTRPSALNFMDDDDDEVVSKPPKATSASFGGAAGPASMSAAGRKKREGDNFLEQLKRDQAAREERLRSKAGYVGSSVTALAARENGAPTLTGNSHYDPDDPLTTNVHVGGLPSYATEDSLGKLFAQYGPVGSVKIMWPRMDSGQLNTNASAAAQQAGRKLGGFVAFLVRRDAERAVKEMDGAEWGDSTLRCGWGKAVPIAQRALYEPERNSPYYDHQSRHDRSSRRSARASSRSRSPPPHAASSSSRHRGGGSHRRSRSPDDPEEFLRSRNLVGGHRDDHRRRGEGGGGRSRSRSRSRSTSPWRRRRSSRSRSASSERGEGRRGGGGGGRRSSRREWPELEPGVDENFLTKVANKVQDLGRSFEQNLRARERGNEKFAFLENDSLPSYHYFRMLIDRDYVPPPVARFRDEGEHAIYSSDSSEDSEQERVGRGRLGRIALGRFEAMLRGLTSTRETIARAMSFALEHADCAAFIADLLVGSLTIDTTPVPRKLARLHLVSDILHNASASVPNAWVYRSMFEKRLEGVFDHFGDVYLSFPGRMKAEQFKGMVEKVIDVWDREWLVFEPKVIQDFKRRLSGIDTISPDEAAIDGDVTSEIARAGGGGDEKGREERQEEGAREEEEATTNRQGGGGQGFIKSSFKAATFAPAASAPSTGGKEEEEEGDVDGAPVEMEDDDVDGAAIDGDAVDVDGEALGDGDEDLDGAPVEDDRAREPMPVD